MLTALVLGGTRNGITYISQMCAEIPGLIVVRSLDRLPKLHNLGRVLNAFAPELVILEACDDEPWMELAQLMIDHHPGTLLRGRLSGDGLSIAEPNPGRIPRPPDRLHASERRSWRHDNSTRGSHHGGPTAKQEGPIPGM